MITINNLSNDSAVLKEAGSHAVHLGQEEAAKVLLICQL